MLSRPFEHGSAVPMYNSLLGTLLHFYNEAIFEVWLYCFPLFLPPTSHALVCSFGWVAWCQYCLYLVLEQDCLDSIWAVPVLGDSSSAHHSVASSFLGCDPRMFTVLATGRSPECEVLLLHVAYQEWYLGHVCDYICLIIAVVPSVGHWRQLLGLYCCEGFLGPCGREALGW